MKKILCFLFTLILLVGCAPHKAPIPQNCIYTNNGIIEIVSVSIDNTMLTEDTKFVKIDFCFTNNTDKKLFVSRNNIMFYCENKIINTYNFSDGDPLTLAPAVLEPGAAHYGSLWYEVPIDSNIITVECSLKGGQAKFHFNI